MQSKDINERLVQLKDVETIDLMSHRLLPKSEVKPLDVLITMAGTIGNCAVASKKWQYPVNSNQAVAKLGLKQEWSPYFVVAYLNCYYGQSYFQRIPNGSVQDNLLLWQIDSIPIFQANINFQKVIEALMLKAEMMVLESQNLLVESESTLLDAINLSAWSPIKKLGYVAKYSETKAAKRVDAEYFRPNYIEIEDAIKSYNGGFSRVGTEFRQNLSKLNVNPSENYDYVEIGSIDVSSGELEKSCLKGEDLPANAKRCLQKGDVIVSKVRTYRGGIAIVPEDNLIGSGAFVVLSETGSIAKEVLYTFLKSKPLLQWSLKPNTGTSYPVIHDSDILNLNIPLFDADLQSDVCDLVKESQNKRKESKRLLEVAKRAVEIAIEENEDAAFEYINAETS